MIIKFSEKELNNLQIKYTGKHVFSSEYIRDRNIAWDKLVQGAKDAGKEFWNGELYTFERIYQNDLETPIIEFGSFEYKDRLFKKSIGIDTLDSTYGVGHLKFHCGTNCFIVTNDNKLVIGKKKNTTNLEKNVYAFISGNLNKDELEIDSFEDIKLTIKKEIEEESSLVVDVKKLKFHQINFFNSYFSFEFLYKVDFDSSQVSKMNKDDEFVGFEALSPEEIYNLDSPMISDLRYSKNYILDILADLDK